MDKNKDDETIEWTRSSGDSTSLRHCVSRIYWFIPRFRPRLPRSRRCRRRYRRLVVSLNFSSSLRTRAPNSIFDCGKLSFPVCVRAALQLWFTSIDATSVPEHIIVPGIDDVALVMPGLCALIRTGYIHIHGLSMILWHVMSLRTVKISSYLLSKDSNECYTHVRITKWCKTNDDKRYDMWNC